MDSVISKKTNDESAMVMIETSIVAGDSSNSSTISSCNDESVFGELISPEEFEDYRNIFGEKVVRRRGVPPISIYSEPWFSISKGLDAISARNGPQSYYRFREDNSVYEWTPPLLKPSRFNYERKIESHKKDLLMLGMHCPAVQRWLKEQVYAFFLYFCSYCSLICLATNLGDGIKLFVK